MAAMERLHQDALLPGPGHIDPPPLTLPLMPNASPTPLPLVHLQGAGRAVRRLPLGADSTQAAEFTPQLDELDEAGYRDSKSPVSSYSLPMLDGRYPTPPEAPRKDQYISESEEISEAESPLSRVPVKVFQNGKLLYHKSYKGPEPITFVDTGLYQGGRNDFYEAYNERDLCWVRRIDYLMDAHKIPRFCHPS